MHTASMFSQVNEEVKNALKQKNTEESNECVDSWVRGMKKGTQLLAFRFVNGSGVTVQDCYSVKHFRCVPHS